MSAASASASEVELLRREMEVLAGPPCVHAVRAQTVVMDAIRAEGVAPAPAPAPAPAIVEV